LIFINIYVAVFKRKNLQVGDSKTDNSGNPEVSLKKKKTAVRQANNGNLTNRYQDAHGVVPPVSV
jgi:hypothetical protein